MDDPLGSPFFISHAEDLTNCELKVSEAVEDLQSFFLLGPSTEVVVESGLKLYKDITSKLQCGVEDLRLGVRVLTTLKREQCLELS
jgi:hypothetical protein